MDEQVLCVQLKHNEKFEKEKLRICLEKRKSLLDQHGTEFLIFIYFATTPDVTIRTMYPSAKTYPKSLDLLLTNKDCVYFDQEDEKANTYFCMNQHTVSKEGADIKQALANYIGQHHLSEDHLKEIQTKFMEYIRKRYLRLLKGSEPLTNAEVCQQLMFAILNKFKIEYKPSNIKLDVANNLEEILQTSPVVIFNHRWSSIFKDQIWLHLMLYLEKQISKKHLKSSNLDELWMEGKLHMPLVSSSREDDKTILRALEIGEFKPKVIILRPRTFNIKEGQEIITILQNLDIVDEQTLSMKTKEETENFKISNVNLTSLIKNKNLKLHQDSFAEISRDYFRNLSSSILEDFIETHDEFNYVNDFNYFGNELLSAIFAAIQIKNIPIKIIQQLIHLGSDVNASAEGGLRPIFYAMRENRPDIVQLLLENLADPNPADKDGIRPLFMACIDNKVEIAKILIKHGADRNTADFYGVRPLFMAYNNGNFEILRLILKDFEHAAAANTMGSHILHKMAEDGSVEGLQCILECCSDVKIFMTGDVKGKTPLDIARDNGNDEFVGLLEKALKLQS
ncbi:hypothetical protein ILUMI_13748 [Ignelater luminosus]|uniref:Ankyrin repeat protein n=1 Tax=Ignelater luminosus TaxID=2038154 RepID=A0A8K0CW53_IGNLU|nr:hypothetical protein ILUMI_13748 [Ignelater luminosus]